MAIQEVKNGSVASAEGFVASGMHCGIKPIKRKYDASLIFSEVPAVSAGVFTINKAKAWPLVYDEKIMGRPTHRAILANSGNANCFNGISGKKTVEMSLKALSKELKIKAKDILLASTGIIGRPFPIDKLKAAIPVLVKSLSKEGGNDAARGILTTDIVPKEIAVRFRIGGKVVTMGGIAKGSGMVYPHMTLSGKRHATMLCFITTDLVISKTMLKKAVASVSDQTFNNIAIDNDISTNDMVILLANGLAKNPKITKEDKSYETFVKALHYICTYLAREMVKDGEGVQHVCEVKILGAKSTDEAKRAGKQIITSMLFKTMLTGEDPNWGRVVAAVGASQVEFSPKIDVSFDGMFILKNGRYLIHNKNKLRKVLRKKEFTLQVNLKKGKATETFLTTDLTKFYVWINSSYSS